MANKIYRIVYTLKASKEIKEAKEWYSEKSKDLLKNLINNIKDLQTKIKNNPFLPHLKMVT